MHNNACAQKGADPWKCLSRSIIEAAAVVGLTLALNFATGVDSPSFENVVTFVTLFVPVIMFLKSLGLDMADAFPRVAGFQLANKLFATLA